MRATCPGRRALAERHRSRLPTRYPRPFRGSVRTSTTRLRHREVEARRVPLLDAAERAGAARLQGCEPEQVGSHRSRRSPRQLPTQQWPRCRPPRVVRSQRASRLLRASGPGRRTRESVPASRSPAARGSPSPCVVLASLNGARCGSALGPPQLNTRHAVLLGNPRAPGDLIGARHSKARPERRGPSAVSPNLREGSPYPGMLPRWDIGRRASSTRPLSSSAAALTAAC